MSFHDLMAHFSLALSRIPLSGWTFYPLPAEGHLGCFQALANMNKTAITSVCRFYMDISFLLLWANTKGV